MTTAARGLAALRLRQYRNGHYRLRAEERSLPRSPRAGALMGRRWGPSFKDVRLTARRCLLNSLRNLPDRPLNPAHRNGPTSSADTGSQRDECETRIAAGCSSESGRLRVAARRCGVAHAA